jgi:hypothetical protein
MSGSISLSPVEKASTRPAREDATKWSVATTSSLVSA